METSCPKCGSKDLHAGQKGFDDKKAVLGELFHGERGIAEGNYGSNKVIITCLACGHQFYPGKDQKPVNPGAPAWQYKFAKVGYFILAGIAVIIALGAIAAAEFGMFAICILIGALLVFLGIRSKKPAIK